MDYLEDGWYRWIPQHYTELGWEWKAETETHWRSLKPMDYDVMKKLVSKERIHRLKASKAKAPLPRPKLPFRMFGDITLENSGEYVHARVPIKRVCDVLAYNPAPVICSFTLLSTSQDPPLDRETMVDMVLKGPTEEHKFIGIPKVLGDVQVDGSEWLVEII